MNDVELFLEIFVMGAAITILVMTIISYRLAKSSKLLILSAAFFLFFIRGLGLFLGNFFSSFEDIPANSYWLGIDFLILICIYVAITRK